MGESSCHEAESSERSCILIETLATGAEGCQYFG
jgi:hypothetical protein